MKAPRASRRRVLLVAGALLATIVILPAVAKAEPVGSAFARLLRPHSLMSDATEPADSIATPAPAPAFALGLREDRWQHATMSFALTAAAGAAGLDPGPAALAALGLGVAKELFDARADRFDAVDLAADAAGALLAALALGVLTR